MVKVENDFISYEIKEGVLFAAYKENVIITEDVAKQVVDDRLKLQDGNSYPALVDCRGIKYASSAGQKILAEQGSEGMTKIALIVANFALAIMGDFYLYFSKPKSQTKAFSNKKKAMKWLLS